MGELFLPGENTPHMLVDHSARDARPEDGVSALVHRHPFQHTGQALQMPEGATILDIVMASGIEERFHGFIRVWINETEVPREMWARVRPRIGAHVYIRVVPQGGDRGRGGKNILAQVLMLVVVVAAAYFAPMIASSMFPSLTGAGLKLATSAIGAGLTMIGALAVNALIPPPSPDSGIASQLELLSGVRNQFRPYAEIPRIFGRRRVYPLQAARPYTEAQGNDRYLRVLLCVGWGPLRISDIKIGDTPITGFRGVEVEVREGWTDSTFGALPAGKTADAPPSLFTSAVTEEQMNIRLLGGTPGEWVTRVTGEDADEFSVDVVCPGGLAGYDSRGRRTVLTVRVDVQYRLFGTSNPWASAVWAGPDAADGTQSNGFITITDGTQSAVFRGGRVILPTRGQYEVRLRRQTVEATGNNVDRVDWFTLRTIRYQNPVNQPGLAMIAIRLKASDQLNGIPDTINCVAESYLPVWNGSTWSYEISRSPAWAFADVLRRRGPERMIADSRIDLPTIATWASEAAATASNAPEPKWTFDGIVEKGAMFTTLRQIAAHSRANFLVRDGRYSVVRDIPQTVPVQHITPRNSLAYSGSKTFLEQPHALRVKYVNADNGYQEDEVIVYNDGYSAANATRFEAIDYPACTSMTQAWREGRYHMAVGILRPEEHSVTMDIENLRCTLGDLVQLSHDVLSIGIAQGRVKALTVNGANVTHVQLDGMVPNLTGNTYVLRVRRADGSSTIYPIAAAASDADRDVLQLTTPTPTSAAPQVGDLFIYGLSAQESAPMIIKKIEPGDNLSARITLVDAQPGVYTSDTSVIPPFNTYITSPTPYSQLPEPPRGVYLRSDYTAALRQADGTIIERLAVTIPRQTSSFITIATYVVQYRQTGMVAWIDAGRTTPDENTVFIVGVIQGVSYDVRVAAITTTGIWSGWTQLDGHVIVGVNEAPLTVSGLTATPGFGEITLNWTRNTEADLLWYEVYVSATNTAPTAETEPTVTVGSNAFTNTGIAPNTLRYYWVRAVNTTRVASAWVGPVSATTLTVASLDGAPAVPGSLTLSSTLLGDAPVIYAGWATASGAVQYEIGIQQAGQNEYVVTVGNNAYQINALGGVTYVFRVRAVNAVGSKSAWSGTQQITAVTDTAAPGQVTGLTATGGFEAIWLSWTASTATDLDFYEIYESTTTTAPTAGTAATYTSFARVFVRDALVGAVTRHYWVRAVDRSGNRGAWSVRVQATTVLIQTADLGDQIITAAQLTTGELLTLSAQIRDAIITNAKIVDLDAAKITAGTVLSNQVIVSNRALGTIVEEAQTAGMIIDFGTVAQRALWTAGGGALTGSADSLLGTAGLFTYSGASPAAYSNAVYFQIPLSIALTHTGKRVRVTVLAKQPLANASAEFGVIYSTGATGNSGWRLFTPDAAYQSYSFHYTVPADNVTSNYIAIWADTANLGAGILIDRVTIEVSSEDYASDPAARINAQATTIDGSRITTGTLNADAIGAGVITSNFLQINTAMEIDAVNAGFQMGKISAFDLDNDGIYLGRTQAQDLSTGFGFVVGRTQPGGLNQFIQANKDDGLRIVNAGFFRDLAVSVAATYYSTSQTVLLSPQTTHIDLQLIGGGKGGRGNVGYGGNGGTTVVQLYDGGTFTGIQWVSNGATHQNSGQNGRGQNSVWGTGGNAGYFVQTGTNKIGDPVYEYYAATAATGWGAGGGGYPFSDGGGGAATLTNVTLYNIGALALADPRLVITVGGGGGGGAGSNSTTAGRNGSQGLVYLKPYLGGLLPANVVPLAPTAVGTMTNQSFPNLGAGLWVLQYNAGDNNIALGTITIDTKGTTMRFVYGTNAVFVSDRTPIGSTEFGSRTVNYRFYRMG